MYSGGSCGAVAECGASLFINRGECITTYRGCGWGDRSSGGSCLLTSGLWRILGGYGQPYRLWGGGAGVLDIAGGQEYFGVGGGVGEGVGGGGILGERGGGPGHPRGYLSWAGS